MSPETERIRRFDLIWSEMLKNQPFEWVEGRVCDACGKRSRALLADKTGRCVCADCHGLPSWEGWFGIPTSCPQGSLLDRLPLSPKFTKKFPST